MYIQLAELCYIASQHPMLQLAAAAAAAVLYILLIISQLPGSSGWGRHFYAVICLMEAFVPIIPFVATMALIPAYILIQKAMRLAPLFFLVSLPPSGPLTVSDR